MFGVIFYFIFQTCLKSPTKRTTKFASSCLIIVKYSLKVSTLKTPKSPSPNKFIQYNKLNKTYKLKYMCILFYSYKLFVQSI